MEDLALFSYSVRVFFGDRVALLQFLMLLDMCVLGLKLFLDQMVSPPGIGVFTGENIVLPSVSQSVSHSC